MKDHQYYNILVFEKMVLTQCALFVCTIKLEKVRIFNGKISNYRN